MTSTDSKTHKVALLPLTNQFLQQLFCFAWIKFLKILLSSNFFTGVPMGEKRSSLIRETLITSSKGMRPWNSVFILHPSTRVGDFSNHTTDQRAEPSAHNSFFIFLGTHNFKATWEPGNGKEGGVYAGCASEWRLQFSVSVCVCVSVCACACVSVCVYVWGWGVNFFLKNTRRSKIQRVWLHTNIFSVLQNSH